MFSFVPSAITQPFFELQTPDFAWKFISKNLDNFFIFIASDPKLFVYLQKIVLQIMAKTKFRISTPKPDFHLST